MKSLSASIVIAAGLATLVVGVSNRHSDSGMFVTAVGGLAALLGFGYWIRSMNEPGP